MGKPMFEQKGWHVKMQGEHYPTHIPKSQRFWQNQRFLQKNHQTDLGFGAFGAKKKKKKLLVLTSHSERDSNK